MSYIGGLKSNFVFEVCQYVIVEKILVSFRPYVGLNLKYTAYEKKRTL